MRAPRGLSWCTASSALCTLLMGSAAVAQAWGTASPRGTLAASLQLGPRIPHCPATPEPERALQAKGLWLSLPSP